MSDGKKSFLQSLKDMGMGDESLETLAAALERPIQEHKTSSLIYALVVGLDDLAANPRSGGSKSLLEIIDEIDRRMPVPVEVYKS